MDLHFFMGDDKNEDYKNTTKMQNAAQIWDHKFPTDHADHVSMTCYPRSGTTLLRAALEGITGIVTGSDTDVSRKPIIELMEKGFQGEGLADRRIWVCKSNFPEKMGIARVPIDRAIVLVRSPMDAIMSFFHMNASGTRDCSISDDDMKKFSGEWTEWVAQESLIWFEFHKWWLSTAKKVHIIRYEDLILHKEECLTDLCKFLFMTKDIKDTRIEQYIKMHCKGDTKEIYKPRQGKVNGSVDLFNEAHKNTLSINCGKMMKNFGYYKLVSSSHKEDEGIPQFIKDRNAMVLENSMKPDAFVNDKPILSNVPQPLLRKKSAVHPFGRTSMRFKQKMRNNVTVVGKSAFKQRADAIEEEHEDEEPIEQPKQADDADEYDPTRNQDEENKQ